MRCSHGHWRRTCAGPAVAGLLLGPAGAGAAHAEPVPPPAPTSSAVPPAAPGGFPVLDGETAARLDRAVRDALREAPVPGATVGLWAPGKGGYVQSFGTADEATGAPMTPDLNLRIGSGTKTFTVTALLELVDRGAVGLDDTVDRYADGVPNGDRITLRQLAGARSGLYNYSEDEDFFTALTSNPRRPFTPGELLAYSFKHPVQFAPGAEFPYSNTNLILLGLVVEKAGGAPLDVFVRDNVLIPAGLHRTLFPTGAEFPVPHAHGYTDQTADGQRADATDWNPSWGWAAGR